MGSFGFFEIINTLVVAIPKSYRWPMGDEGKQAMLQGGVSGPPPYPAGADNFLYSRPRRAHSEISLGLSTALYMVA